MPNNMDRRFVLSMLGVAAIGLPGTAFALDTAQARQLIDSAVADINSVINSGRSQEQMFADFERIFAKYADVDIIARSALGIAARSASPTQLAAFTKAFRGYMARKYGRRFREFIGGRIEVNAAREIKSIYEVSATAYLQGSKPLDVVFLVSDKSGRNLFFNLFIEGVNMMASERTEIGAMLDRRGGNVDQLIQDLARAG